MEKNKKELGKTMSLPAKIMLIVWVIVLLLLGYVLVVPARAHETAAAEGIPEYVYQSGCCGKNDCFQIPIENISFTAGGYEFYAPQPDHPNEKYSVSEEEYGKRLRDSSDGKYWACFAMSGRSCKKYSGTGPYGGYCTEYEVKKDPWKLRCFFRPVNA